MHVHITVRLAKQKPKWASINLIFHAYDSLHANTITPYLLYG